MKKALSLLLGLSMSLALFAGCDTGESTPSASPEATEANAGGEEAEKPAEGEDNADTANTGGGVIYGIYKAGDQTWFIDEGAAAEKAAVDAGYDFTYVDAKMSPEECLKAVDNAVANNAAGVVICVPDQTMSQAVVEKLSEANIPVVAADDALENNGEKIAPWVGIDGYVIGAANGEWMANYARENNLLEDESAGLLILTMDTVSSVVPRTEGEFDKFTELSPEFDVNRIFKADTDGTTDKGNSVAAAMFTAHPEIKTWLVMGGNEEITIGAARALESAGLDANACVVGLGAYMAKDEFKKEGGSCMKAAAYFSSDSVGGGSIAVLLDTIAGKEVPMETAVDAVIVTPDNYQEIMGAAAE